jgi:hypothetical protein
MDDIVEVRMFSNLLISNLSTTAIAIITGIQGHQAPVINGTSEIQNSIDASTKTWPESSEQ